jgi:hypothetical protein
MPPIEPYRPRLFDRVASIKALSLWQPWASLVAAGLKPDETRDWFTPYRGPLAIHAAKRLDLAGAPHELCDAGLDISWRGELPLGAVVAIAELVDVMPADVLARQGAALTRANLAAGNFAPGRLAWRLANIRPLHRPIPLVGRQALFNWTPPDDLDERLGPVVDHLQAAHRIGWGLVPRAEHA